MNFLPKYYYSTEKYLDGNLNFAKDVNNIKGIVKGVFMKLCLMIFDLISVHFIFRESPRILLRLLIFQSYFSFVVFALLVSKRSFSEKLGIRIILDFLYLL